MWRGLKEGYGPTSSFSRESKIFLGTGFCVEYLLQAVKSGGICVLITLLDIYLHNDKYDRELLLKTAPDKRTLRKNQDIFNVPALHPSASWSVMCTVLTISLVWQGSYLISLPRRAFSDNRYFPRQQGRCWPRRHQRSWSRSRDTALPAHSHVPPRRKCWAERSGQERVDWESQRKGRFVPDPNNMN